MSEATVTQMDERKSLPRYKGRQVTEVGVEIPGASGGLRDPMRFEPVVHEHFEDVYVLLKCRVQDIDLRGITEKNDLGEEVPTKNLRWVEKLSVKGGMFMDAARAEREMNAHLERMAEYREAEKGGLTLLAGGDDSE